MTIVKVSSIACASCIIINNILERILENYKVHIKEYDYDFDDVPYEVGTVLPVLIFLDKDEKEYARLIGEVSYEQIEEKIKELGE
jgi:predicted DsbA family dithiol-disulfide isomerase